MKKTFTFILFFFICIKVFSQTDGISYQAVIIGPDNQELPGVDAEGNILPDATVAIRFTIIDANNGMEYQETQTTNTDQYGRINLTIGSVNPDDFSKIGWDGTSKDLKVEIDFSGTGGDFIDMSREKLTFLPYAYHRNITAAGTLKVDDATDLNGELVVAGPTTLKSILDVDGATSLNSSLSVTKTTTLNDTLNVGNRAPSNFTGDLNVAPTGTAKFDGDALFNGNTSFKDISINGQTKINANVDSIGGQGVFNAYPLLIEGSSQGVAIKVNGGRSNDNNYVSFWDADTGEMWGRIEGQTLPELKDDPEFEFEQTTKEVDVGIAGSEVAMAGFELAQAYIETTARGTASTACVGLGACVTAPPISMIVSGTANVIKELLNFAIVTGNLVLTSLELVKFNDFKKSQIGVTYQSGAGDYAEWLPKENPLENFNPGDLIGIKSGMVTKNTWGVEKIMIVSTRPIVLGNMPQKNDEINNVKIAFMGQVPVKVIGKIIPGDYILPSVAGGGFAKAVSPKDMKIRDYKKVAGVAWSVMGKISESISLVNVAVGINTNDLGNVVSKQEEELTALQERYSRLNEQFTQSNRALSTLVPGYAEYLGFENTSPSLETTKTKQHRDKKIADEDIVHSDEEDIVYFEISREHIESAINVVRSNYQDMIDTEQTNGFLTAKGKGNKLNKTANNLVLPPMKDHPFWQQLDSDPDYKEEIILYVQSNMEKAMHTHKRHAHNFTDMKVRN